MMRWIAAEGKDSVPESMQQVMESQVNTLRDQMVSVSKLEAEVSAEQSPPGIQGFMVGRRFITRGRV